MKFSQKNKNIFKNIPKAYFVYDKKGKCSKVKIANLLLIHIYFTLTIHLCNQMLSSSSLSNSSPSKSSHILVGDIIANILRIIEVGN